MNTPFTHYKEMLSQFSYNQANLTEFVTLEKTIRKGSQPNSPTLLLRYFELGQQYADHQPKHLQKNIHTSILDTLLDTICDTYIEAHWRHLCLDYCYKPLSSLKRLAANDQDRQHLQQQYQKVRTLSHYFC